MPLAACSQPNDPKAAASQAAPEAKPGLAVGAARLVLPAVKGNPGVAYFTLANTGSGTAALAAITVSGAAIAEIHQTAGGEMKPVDRIDIAPGTTIAFAPGGLHVMLFGLGGALKPGTPAEMTLTFADGDKLSAPLTIEAAGAAMGDNMAGMHHGKP